MLGLMSVFRKILNHNEKEIIWSIKCWIDQVYPLRQHMTDSARIERLRFIPLGGGKIMAKNEI